MNTQRGAGTAGALIVRIQEFEDNDPIPGVQATIAPIDDPSRRILGAAYGRVTTSIRRFSALTAGRYVLSLRRLGYYERTDTLLVRARMTDTVDAALELWSGGYRNLHNCRPRGFRHRGEPACVTDGDEMQLVLAYARQLAEPERRRVHPELPIVTPRNVALVRDQTVCDRAGRAYGQPGDPPRRVVVIRLGHNFMVYDPYEPKFAGEWDIISILTGRWKLILSLAS